MNWADKLKDQATAVRPNRAVPSRADSPSWPSCGLQQTYPAEAWVARVRQPRAGSVAPSWNRVTKLRLQPDRF